MKTRTFIFTIDRDNMWQVFLAYLISKLVKLYGTPVIKRHVSPFGRRHGKTSRKEKHFN